MPRSPATSSDRRDLRLGYAFALAAITIFALQDGISKHLGQIYPPVFVTMIRYWAFASFASSSATSFCDTTLSSNSFLVKLYSSCAS